MMRVDIRPEQKTCPLCRTVFSRQSRISHKQWAARVHCSYACSRTVPIEVRLVRMHRAEDGPLDTPCWIWTGPTLHGYGRLIVKRDGKRRHWRAHRLSFLTFTGIDPKGLMVCHRCDNPSCINPKHLFLGTAKDNAEDRERKGRGRPISGERRSDAKLTAAAVKEIRAGGSVADLAVKYGVSRSAIYKARQGVSWSASDD